MTYVVKMRLGPTVVSLYTCPEHGVFECEVKRLENGNAPEVIQCADEVVTGSDVHPLSGEPVVVYGRCELEAIWTPSASIGCRVRRVEVTRGKWEKPERKTYLDTRKLGEGQDPAEFQAERRKMWRERRMRELKDL